MENTSNISDARRILIEKYLQRADAINRVPTPATEAANTVTPSVETEGAGRRERVTPVQTGGSGQQPDQSGQQPDQSGQQPDQSLLPSPANNRRPFFYLHGDWTDRAFYCHPLAHLLGEDQPFYLLEPYNFDDLPVLPSFEAMAAAHLESMRKVQPEGPYQIGGWCNGGLIAYEMALQLLAEGQEVEALVLMDADGPHPARRRLVRKVVSGFCNLLHLVCGQGEQIGPEKQVNLFLLIQHIYRYVRFSHYRARFLHYRRSAGAAPPETLEQSASKQKRSKVALRLPGIDPLIPTAETLRQDWPCMYEWIAYGYVPRALYPGKMTFLWDSKDSWRPVWWREVIAAKADDVEVHVLPGDHITCRTDYLPVLAERVRGSLNRGSRAQAGSRA